jgi:hypothetical protein
LQPNISNPDYVQTLDNFFIENISMEDIVKGRKFWKNKYKLLKTKTSDSLDIYEIRLWEEKGETLAKLRLHKKKC